MDSLQLLRAPWVFLQESPLTTRTLKDEARRRGIELDPATLRELYRQRYFSPLLELTARRQRADVKLDWPRGSRQTDLYAACAKGQVRDPAARPYQPRLRFDDRHLSDPRDWTNGLLYSRWQILDLIELKAVLAQRRFQGRREQRLVRLPQPETDLVEYLARHRHWSLILTALEARYLPVIEPGWLILHGVEPDDWDQFRAAFDPVATLATLGVSAAVLLDRAEHYLLRAHWLDPSGDWYELIRRAARTKWKRFSGPLLQAMDYRIAAEILLLFLEDLVRLDQVPPLPQAAGLAWSPLADRLSADRDKPLDDVLSELGVSPHTRVVLAVEGETEELLLPRVFDTLELPRFPELVRILCMRGSDKNLALAAAIAVAPLIGDQRGDSNTYELLRPPARLVIAVDSDTKRWATEEAAEEQRQLIVDEIDLVVRAQGVELNREVLQEFVEVHRWSGGCFEYEHFSDEELCDALLEMPVDRRGISRLQLLDRLAKNRARRRDVDHVWKNWMPKVDKRQLTETLWPVLEAKLHDLDAPLPSIGEVVTRCYRTAMDATRVRFVVDGVPAADRPRSE